MGREIIETHQQAGIGNVVRLVQDRHDNHDNPEHTDRWFVECSLRFPDEETARAVLEKLKGLL